MRRLLIAVRRMLDQRLLGLFEALGLSASALDDRSLRGIEVLVAGDAADARRLGGRGVDLILLVARI